MSRWKTDAIYAHRGYYQNPSVPENSMAAFREATARGFGAELDVHLLSDGTLAVFHDSELFRCTGEQGIIEELDISSLKSLRLFGTEERIPTLDEVIGLFEGTGCPLIVEIKPYGKNHKELTCAVCEKLMKSGLRFVIESFDPRVLLVLKKSYPEIIRGQLSQNFIEKDEGLPYWQRLLLTYLVTDAVTKPDFIAYRWSDRKNIALRRAVDKRGVCEASWTIKTKEEFEAAKKARCVQIFERFDEE